MPTGVSANRPTIDYVLAATLKASGLTYAQIAKQIGCSPGSLKVGFLRRGIHNQVTAAKQYQIARIDEHAHNSLESASEALRNDFAALLGKHSLALAKVPAKANLKHIKAAGEALEPLVRSAKTVFDWGSTDAAGLVVVGRMKQAIEAEEVPAVACGVEPSKALPDTPTGSVPENTPTTSAEVQANQPVTQGDSADNNSYIQSAPAPVDPGQPALGTQSGG